MMGKYIPILIWLNYNANIITSPWLLIKEPPKHQQKRGRRILHIYSMLQNITQSTYIYIFTSHIYAYIYIYVPYMYLYIPVPYIYNIYILHTQAARPHRSWSRSRRAGNAGCWSCWLRSWGSLVPGAWRSWAMVVSKPWENVGKSHVLLGKSTINGNFQSEDIRFVARKWNETKNMLELTGK